MPAPKFDRAFVKIIAEEAGVPENAVWISLPNNSIDKVSVIFWTTKMNRRQFERLASTGASNFRGSHGGGITKRAKVASFLEGFNAEGWLSKVHPREAQPRDLYPLKGLREWCRECNTKLMTPEEQYIGKCEGCSPK